MGTLPGKNRHQHSPYDGEVKYPSLLMHDEWRQEAIMKEKQDQEDGERAPDDQHLRPVERGILITHRSYIQTQEWGQKEQAPHYQIRQVLMSRLILHPIHLFYINVKKPLLLYQCHPPPGPPEGNPLPPV
jgi:hypothetical protein